MDKELIEKLVKDAGIEDFYRMNGWAAHINNFASLVAEECAKVCDAASEDASWEYPDPKFAAANIRAKFPRPE